MDDLQCYVWLTAIAKDGEGVFEKYIGDIPFVPNKGMMLMIDGGETYIRVDDVWYDVDDRTVIVHDHDKGMEEHDCPCTPADDCCTIANEMEWKIEDGWKLLDVRRGDKRERLLPGHFPTTEEVKEEATT